MIEITPSDIAASSPATSVLLALQLATDGATAVDAPSSDNPLASAELPPACALSSTSSSPPSTSGPLSGTTASTPGAPWSSGRSGRASTITLDIPLEPVAKGRPRVTSVGRRRAYTPNATKAAERAIAAYAKQALGDEWRPLVGPLRLGVIVLRPVPATLPADQQTHCLPQQRPDLDNFVKLISDALSPQEPGGWGVWRDDAQIVELVAAKRYAVNRAPGWVVTVEELTAAGPPVLGSVPSAIEHNVPSFIRPDGTEHTECPS